MTEASGQNRERPFFSIIVPCCDVAPYVNASLDSLLTQDFTDFECIIGVERSKDETERLVRDAAAKDARIRVFTGERSGSCSASRNTGIGMARGQYVLFVDGDDTIEPGSLKHIHDKIAANPGADLYPCAMRVHNEITGRDEPLRDNYPPDFTGETTGPEATVMLERRMFYPCPMLQLTVFRREFLIEHDLKCIHGIRHQDSEFSPRALYLARRVAPLHEPFYVYRIRENSVQTAAKGKGYFLKDFAIGLKSLFAFHAKVSRAPGFDRRVSASWARTWVSTLLIKWFSRDFVKSVPRRERLETLKIVFGGGFADFDALLSGSSGMKRIAGWWVKAFVRCAPLRFAAERFFVWVYFPLARSRRRG